jgi:hypothetical protein
MSTISIITLMLMRDQGRTRFLVAENFSWLPGCERGSIHSRPAMLSAGVTGVSVGTAASWLRILGKETSVCFTVICLDSMGINPVLLARYVPLHGGVDVDIFQAMGG